MGTPGTTNGLPFATANGTPKGGGGASGGNDFLTKPQGSRAPSGGGFDPVTQHRPQPPMKTQAGLPDAASVPNGGKILKADPGKVAVSAGGDAERLGSEKKPFRVGK